MFETVAKGTIVDSPPSLAEIRMIPSGLQFRGTGLSETLSLYSNEKLLRTLVNDHNYPLVIGTPVEEILLKIIAELRENTKKLKATWRWKTIKMLPVNLEDKGQFLSNCQISEARMTLLVKRIMTDIIPFDLLGKDNFRIMSEFLVKYLFTSNEERQKMEYARMYLKHSLPIRAMRSPEFRARIEGGPDPLNMIQKSTFVSIKNFITRVTIALVLQFVQMSRPYPNVVKFFSKRGFNFWRKKEMRLFKEDYQMEKVQDHIDQTPKHVISKTRIMSSGTTMRPICPFPKSSNWAYSNSLQFMNNALDFHLKQSRNGRLLGVSWEIRKLKTFLALHRAQRPDKKLYFIKADVSKCFASMKRDILQHLLVEIVGGRTAVVAYMIVKHNDKFFRLYGVGANEAAARRDLEMKKVRKHKDKNILGKVQIQRFYTDLADVIINMVEQLRFTVYGNSRQLYRMNKGVPQGCILSSRLSHIYLLDYDKKVLQPMLTPGSRIFRYADDYLIVVDDKEKALDILDTIQRPNNPYGLHFKPEKNKISFNGGNYKKERGNLITWCGASIDTKRRQVLPRKRTATVLVGRNRRTVKGSLAEIHMQIRRMWKECLRLEG